MRSLYGAMHRQALSTCAECLQPPPHQWGAPLRGVSIPVVVIIRVFPQDMHPKRHLRDPTHLPMTSISPDIASVQTLPQLLAYRAARTPDADAYRAFDPATQAWICLTWAQTAQRVAQWSQAMAAMPLPAAARVAILLPNGLDAMCADQSTLATGHVPVPLHAIDNPGSIAYILADCEASMLIVGQAAQWERIRGIGTQFPALRTVVITGEDAALASSAATAEGPAVGWLAQWLAGTAQATELAAPTPPGPDDLAALVYTSGTTGKPKGVMLTHRNVVSDVKAVLERIAPMVDDVFLSFLPLSHTFERTGGYYRKSVV